MSYNNFNDRFREFIRFANREHALRRLDFILATGDLIDYLFEPGDDPRGGGNFEFFRDLVLGQARGPDGKRNEELRVPIFTTLGNHDYRAHPYRMVFSVRAKASDLIKEIPVVGGAIGSVFDLLGGSAVGKSLFTRNEFLPYNLTLGEAQALEGVTAPFGNRRRFITPILQKSQAERALSVDRGMRDETGYYFRAINRDGSFVIRLGPHRIVMINTRFDSGITKSAAKALAASLGWGAEETVRFVQGFVNSEGFRSEDYTLLQRARTEAGSTGILVVAMHAPPLCHAGDEFSHFFRETEHRQADPANTVDFLLRHWPPPLLVGPIAGKNVGFGISLNRQFIPMTKLPAKALRGWSVRGTPFFRKAAEVDNSLGQGIADEAKRFLKMCAGGDGGRAINAILTGHKHRRTEYRLRWDAPAKKIEFLMDFYTENPKEYYASREHATGNRDIRIRVNENATAPGPLAHQTREVPGYADPLSRSRNPRVWWNKHSPVLLGTSSLGPMDENQRIFGPTLETPDVPFQGIRLLSVKNHVIERIRYVAATELTRGMPLAPFNVGAAVSAIRINR